PWSLAIHMYAGVRRLCMFFFFKQKTAYEMGLSVRQVEEWGRAGKENGKTPPPPPGKLRGASKDADTVALERRVTDALGLEVTVDHRGEAGVVHVRYRSLDQLDEIVRRLERKG